MNVPRFSPLTHAGFPHPATNPASSRHYAGFAHPATNPASYANPVSRTIPPATLIPPPTQARAQNKHHTPFSDQFSDYLNNALFTGESFL